MGLLDAPVTRDRLASTEYAELRPWFAALSNRRNQKAVVAFIGDSTVEGAYLGSGDILNTLPAALAASLRARFPVTGVAGGRGWVGLRGTVAAGQIPFNPWVNPGPAVLGDGYSPDLVRASLSTAGAKVTLTPQSDITSFDIVHLKYSGGGAGAGYYKVNGGAAVNFDTNNATNVYGVINVPVTGPTTSIEIGRNSAVVSLAGVIEYRGDEAKGVVVHRLGYSGTTTSNWNSYAPAAGSWRNGLAALAPHLVIIQLGINDALVSLGNSSAATFKTNLTSLIANARVGAPSPTPIVLSMTFAPNNSPLVEAWGNYVTKAKEIAAADPTVIVVDHSQRMPPVADADSIGLYNAANLPHASVKGYSLMAETLTAAISPR